MQTHPSKGCNIGLNKTSIHCVYNTTRSPPHIASPTSSLLSRPPSLRNCAEPETRYATLRHSPKAGYQLLLSVVSRSRLQLHKRGRCVRSDMHTTYRSCRHQLPDSDRFQQGRKSPRARCKARRYSRRTADIQRRRTNVRRRRSASECPDTVRKAAFDLLAAS